jgi:hypothetical protein
MKMNTTLVLLPLVLLGCEQPGAAGPAVATDAASGAGAVASATPMPTSLAPPPVVVTDPSAPGPVSQRCEARATAPGDPHGVSRAMRIGSDGGWCADTLSAAYPALDVATAPQHGTVVVHKLSAAHAVYYQPQPGYVGSDLVVLRIMPSAATLTLKVVVGP